MRRLCLAAALMAAALGAQPEPRRFVFTIHPKLPKMEVTLRFVREGELLAPAEMRIRRMDRTAPSQTFERQDLEGEPLPYEQIDYLWAVDMNFDGYLDLQFLNTLGATGNSGSRYWLYNPARARFEFNQSLSELGGAKADAATRTIHTYSKGGAAGMVYWSAVHAWENGKLVTLEEESQNYPPGDNSGNWFVRVVKQRRNGRLVEVSRERVKAPE